MSISAGEFLKRFVAYQWFVTIFMAEYAVIVWDVVHWVMGLKEPSAGQLVLSAVLTGGLPIMTGFYVQAMNLVVSLRGSTGAA